MDSVPLMWPHEVRDSDDQKKNCHDSSQHLHLAYQHFGARGKSDSCNSPKAPIIRSIKWTEDPSTGSGNPQGLLRLLGEKAGADLPLNSANSKPYMTVDNSLSHQ